MLGSLAMLVAGVVGLVVGSELAVSAAERLARWLGVSRWLVGVTIASIGTSLPEISTNVAAAWTTRLGTDASELAVGNVVGSCLSQITLLLGITALLSPMWVPRRARQRDLPSLFAALGLMWLAALDGRVDGWEAALLVTAYAVYLGWCIVSSRPGEGEGEDVPADPKVEDGPSRFTLGRAAMGIVGMIVVVVSADAVVRGGVSLAEAWGLGRTTIGLLVGLGTGLPELAIAVRAVVAGASSLSLGNLIGSNITDPLLTLGSGALIHPLSVRPEVLQFDLPVWLVSTLVAWLFLWSGKRLTRIEGAVLVLLFVGYAYARVTLSAAGGGSGGFHTLPWV